MGETPSSGYYLYQGVDRSMGFRHGSLYFLKFTLYGSEGQFMAIPADDSPAKPCPYTTEGFRVNWMRIVRNTIVEA